MELELEIDRACEFAKTPPPNESNTCEWVILPLLYAAGYARREIISRSADANGQYPDYTILHENREHSFFLEAKSWTVALQDQHANQALNYANQNGRQWVVLTNGHTWRLYDNRIMGVASAKLVVEVNLLQDKNAALRFLRAIGRASVLAGCLTVYVSDEQAERRRRIEEEKSRLDRQSRENRLRPALLAAFTNPDGTLIRQTTEFLRTQPNMGDVTSDDVVRALSSILDAWRTPVPSVNTMGTTGGTGLISSSSIVYFVNVGEDSRRNWDDNTKYGYLSAGHGERYRDSMLRLMPGDFIFAYMKGLGYVGFGRVLRQACMIKDFVVGTSKLLDCPLRALRADADKDDPVLAEYAVAVEWIRTLGRHEAKMFPGAFANQNVVCKLRDERTLDFLKKEFGAADYLT